MVSVSAVNDCVFPATVIVIPNLFKKIEPHISSNILKTSLFLLLFYCHKWLHVLILLIQPTVVYCLINKEAYSVFCIAVPLLLVKNTICGYSSAPICL